MSKILITGSAGFIGMHLTIQLLNRGEEVVGLDCINDYYDIKLKFGRLSLTGIDEASCTYGRLIQSKKYIQYRFIKLNLEDKERLHQLFQNEKFDVVVNLAAQAGVRYSLTNPQAYVDSNITGYLNVLEACRQFPVKHLVYASSSSVYGLNSKVPFSVHDTVDHPVSIYAASKKSNELMAHTYSHLFNIPTTGLRFFTVYGPWGRPDMAIFIFTKNILEGKPIQVFNNGEMHRDFTYIDDIIRGITHVLDKPAISNENWDANHPDSGSSLAPFRIYNIGHSSPVNLLDFIREIEQASNKKAIIDFKPLQPGDVKTTWADVNDLKSEFNYSPSTTIEFGIEKFLEWYKEFYQIK